MKPVLFSPFCAALLMLQPSLTMAQNISISDLKSQVDEQAAGLAEYQALLNDPDPARARTAMEIMLVEGDDTLRRMAFNVGITSNDPLMRKKALEGYFAGEPVLSVQIAYDPKAPQSYLRNFAKKTHATIDDDNTLHGSWKIGPWDETNGCWPWTTAKGCAIRLDDDGVSILINERWARLQLNGTDELTGFVSISNKTPSPVTIPITF